MARKRRKRAKHAGAAGSSSSPEMRARPFAAALGAWEKRQAEAKEAAAREADARNADPKDEHRRDQRGARRPPTPAGAEETPRGPGARQGPASPPRPSPPGPRRSPLADRYSWADRVALNDAYLGVRPLDATPSREAGARKGRRRRTAAPVPPPPPPELSSSADRAARARLAALVAGGLRWRLDREEDGRLSGLRGDCDAAALDALRGGRATPEDELDLHGLRGDEAAAEVVRWVRARQREGARVVRVVTGKGLHSETGVGVLQDRVVSELTDGGAAPFVLAFCTADSRGGGRGALLLRLAGR